MARCVFVYTNFSSLISKDDLAFFAKREKKTAELVFLFSLKFGTRIQFNPNHSFLILGSFQTNLEYSYSAQPPLNTIVLEDFNAQFCHRIFNQNTNEKIKSSITNLNSSINLRSGRHQYPNAGSNFRGGRKTK